jgi:hypothetical protein
LVRFFAAPSVGPPFFQGDAMSMTFDMAFWIGMLQIIGIDIVLSGSGH